MRRSSSLRRGAAGRGESFLLRLFYSMTMALLKKSTICVIQVRLLATGSEGGGDDVAANGKPSLLYLLAQFYDNN